MIDEFYTFIGMAGCGKTTLADYLNKKFNITFVDTDRLIEMREGMALEDIKKKNGSKLDREWTIWPETWSK